MRVKADQLIISSCESSKHGTYLAILCCTAVDVEVDRWRDEMQVETAVIKFRGMPREVVAFMLEDAARVLQKAK